MQNLVKKWTKLQDWKHRTWKITDQMS